ncbi:unnamed protein product [Moneuplotes crassus]|uniref:Lipoprotein n=1 Tax=Euplotes crassus TaxID=5936 RepID=A0AAD1UFU9_EUPCR|nr:unnamed protein product [Moneuplotes crassus]
MKNRNILGILILLVIFTLSKSAFQDKTLTYQFHDLTEDTTQVINMENEANVPVFKFPASDVDKPDIIPQGLHFTQGKYLDIDETFPLQYQDHLSMELWIFVSKYKHSAYVVMTAQHFSIGGTTNYLTRISYNEPYDKFILTIESSIAKSEKISQRGWNKLSILKNTTIFRANVYDHFNGDETANVITAGLVVYPLGVLGCSSDCNQTDFIIHSLKLSTTVDYTVTPTAQLYNPYGFQCGDGTRDPESLEECDDGSNTGENKWDKYDSQCDKNCFLGYNISCTDENPQNCFQSDCGDGFFAHNEDCDDGNKNDTDGCDPNCNVETGFKCKGWHNQTCTPICGDLVMKGDEQCDDGNTTDGDGCSSDCKVEDGYDCTGSSNQVCVLSCGNGVKLFPEQCDDGNTNDGDGCDKDCKHERDYLCAGQGVTTNCTRQCGNGILNPTDDLKTTCDDNNTISGDGCDSNCAVESGYICKSPTYTNSICKPRCGDGLIIAPEACDDKNEVSGDGCSSQCTIENNFLCSNKTPTGPSVCKKCEIKHCLECDPKDYDKCIKCEKHFMLKSPTKCYSPNVYEVSENAQQMSSGSQAISGVSAGATIGVSILNLSSIAAIWSIVNQLQLYLLLLLTKTPFPGNVKVMILGNEMMQFNLNIVPINKLPKAPEFMDWLRIEQENIYLETIGIESSTSLLNNFGFAICMIFLLMLYPVVMTLRLCINYENEKKCSFNYVMIKIVDLFNFIIYIRLILGGFQLLLICSLSEVVDFNFSGIPQIISFIFSCLVLVVCLGAIGVSFYVFYSKCDFYDPDKHYKLAEFITGIRNSKYARLYPYMSLTRRSLFVGWLIIFSWFECIYLSIGMLVIQFFYLVALTIVRPFDRPENNIIELVNEVIYTSMISIMIACNSEEEWSGSITSIFCGIIMFNSLIITFIMIGALLVSLCKKCFRKKGQAQTTVQPVHDITVNIGNTRATHRIESDISGIRIISSSRSKHYLDCSSEHVKIIKEARKKSNLERNAEASYRFPN